ncbi:MAG: ROK family protein, partial [Anaerolineae bacterium]|nr:ROK family protein [Anaerolineae bacterium]
MAKRKDSTLGIDLGGTKILAAVVSHKGEISGLSKLTTPSNEGPDAVIDQIVAAAEEAAEQAGMSLKKIAGIGIGAPGVVDSATGVVRFAPNLAHWDEV